jgi:hypothetical protein
VPVSAIAATGLVKLTKRRGIRGSWAPVAEVNRYIRKKFWGTPLLVPSGVKDSQE